MPRGRPRARSSRRSPSAHPKQLAAGEQRPHFLRQPGHLNATAPERRIDLEESAAQGWSYGERARLLFSVRRLGHAKLNAVPFGVNETAAAQQAALWRDLWTHRLCVLPIGCRE